MTDDMSANRLRWTAEMEGVAQMELDGVARTGRAQLDGHPAPLRWKVGVELPPFVSTNTTVVSMLVALYDGALEAVPACAISDAVAVQIWRLINDKDAHAQKLKHVKHRGYYIILASLALGRRVETADQ